MSDAHHGLTEGPTLSFRGMAQCDSKVFFPDDSGQAPQFSDCPRQAVTARRATHSVVRLCAKCAEIWDEQASHVTATDEAPVAVSVSRGASVRLEVPAVTRIREAGHRVL